MTSAGAGAVAAHLVARVYGEETLAHLSAHTQPPPSLPCELCKRECVTRTALFSCPHESSLLFSLSKRSHPIPRSSVCVGHHLRSKQWPNRQLIFPLQTNSSEMRQANVTEITSRPFPASMCCHQMPIVSEFRKKAIRLPRGFANSPRRCEMDTAQCSNTVCFVSLSFLPADLDARGRQHRHPDYIPGAFSSMSLSPFPSISLQITREKKRASSSHRGARYKCV
jgi:hypothetical protein